MDDQIHVDGASPSENKGAVAPEGAGEDKEIIADDPFTSALERLTKTGKKAKQIAEKANNGVIEMQRTLETVAERLERIEQAGLSKAEDTSDEEVVAEDGTKYRKSDVENLKRLAKLSGFQGVSERRMERIEKLLEEREIDRLLDAEDVTPSERRLVREVLKTRITRTDEIGEDVRLAHVMALALAKEHAEGQELDRAIAMAGSASTPVAGRKTARIRVSPEDQEAANALAMLYPDKKVNWAEKLSKRN